MNTISSDTVLTALANHIGAANGARADVLVMEITGGLSNEALERDLRYTITALREHGHHICAHPAAGYYLAANDAELTAACEFLYERAMTSLRQISAMKKVSLPDLRGQLHLPT